MKRSLYIGRFQPFHLGHLSVCKQILAKGEFLLIGIGSAEQNYLPENPFTASERYEMIDRSLQADGVSRDRYAIVPVRNIDNYALWVQHISLILPEFDKVYTGSEIVRDLFVKDGRYQLAELKFEHQINATQVREAMKEDKNWQNLIDPTVSAYLQEIAGIERVEKI